MTSVLCRLLRYLAMMTNIEMEQEEDEQEVQDHGEEE